MSVTKEKIKKLNNQLKKWSKEYYDNDNPSVSDQEYDAVYNTLLKLEKENPEYILEDSVTKKVGGSVSSKFQKVTHKYPMLSLGNAFDEEDLIKFNKQIEDVTHDFNEIEYIVEYKIDGLSVSLIYIDGKLFKAVTRGNGIIGEDVTENVKQISDIPEVLNKKVDIEIRGEIYMKNDIFENLNRNGNNFANPRNAAAGTLRQLDEKIVKQRKLSAFMYSIPDSINRDIKFQSEAIEYINKLGVAINTDYKIAKNINEAIEIVKNIIQLRDKLNYVIDGIVIKVNEIKKWAEIGFTSKFPKFMIAYKFPEETATTELIDIFPTIGRTGRVTYNAKLKPVRLAGTNVQAATLHNADYIREINISIGDIVRVKKAGEIIPKVLGVETKRNKQIWKESKICPACENELIRNEGEVDQYCFYEDCPQKNIAKLEHFVSRGAMDIEGLSIATIETFLNNGLITNIPSIYKLNDRISEMLDLPGFQEKSVNNIINAIEKSKSQDLDKFIFGLGIRHVGAKNAKILAKRFGSLEKIVNASNEEITKIRDLGEKVALSATNFFKDDTNKKMLKQLIDLGMNLKEIAAPISNKFSGMTFVITGTLSQTRTFFSDIIESNNGNISGSVTSKTDYILAGSNAGSKLEKAKNLGIKILNEDSFYKLLEKENHE
ncbi:MAG: NAD-dependent DNA ligase LigA [Mycoplasmatales bacterium]|nr:NAD-dependent DNA ligase LigA [Mycoplasmatales bacterium]